MKLTKLVLEKLSLGFPISEVDNLAEQHIRNQGWKNEDETADVTNKLELIKDLAGDIEGSIEVLKSEVSDIEGSVSDIKEYIKEIKEEID